MRRPLSQVAIVALLALLTLAPSLLARPEEHIDASLVGTLNMANTVYPTQGCGPTSVVNSFTYLQNQYPDYYGGRLIPTDSSPATIANLLGTSAYMKTNESDPGNKGTFYANLVMGKQKYLNETAIGAATPGPNNPGANTTTITGQSDPDNAWPDGDLDNKPPGFSTDHAPTANFILQALHDQKDVEALIESPAGHYVTITRMQWDPATNKGKLDYVDPIGGKLVTDVPLSAYDSDAPIFAGDGEISMVVAEGPSNLPEPSVAMGAIIFLWSSMRVRRLRAR